MSGLPDSTVARAKLGDHAAFAEIVRHYYPRCLRFARNMLGDLADAEDAVQEAFLRVHAALPRYTEYGRFEAWLFRILANQCRTMWARERRRAEWLLRYAPHHAGVAAEPPATDDARGALLREIDRALRELPALLREAFLLYHVEGMGYEQMMMITGARPSALKMRVKRARDLLRARLREVRSA
ncbi:MAG TPA: RNA polymerase sigma factor [Longimicrobiales bacterium]